MEMGAGGDDTIEELLYEKGGEKTPCAHSALERFIHLSQQIPARTPFESISSQILCRLNCEGS